MSVSKVPVIHLQDKLVNDFEEEIDHGEISIITRSKAKVSQEFVLMFVENVQSVAHDLSKNEFLVLLGIVKFSQYQNVYNLTQAKIAEDTKIPQPQVSRAMKKLKERHYLLAKDGIEYINPYLFIKGGITSLKKDKDGALEAVKQLQLFSVKKSF